MTMSKFATIHGGLLARKGEAAPAVRHSHPGVSYSDAPPPPERRPATPLMDAAFGDMRTLQTAAPAPCSPSDREPKPKEPCSRKIPAGEASAGRVSLRLTRRQKRMIMIAGAVLGRSQQKLLSEALDSHLDRLSADELKSCGCFKHQLRLDRASPD